MDALIRQHLDAPFDRVAREEFSQVTLGQLIQTLENLAAEQRQAFRVVHGWRRAHFPDLPLLPINRQLPHSAYQNLEQHLDGDATTLIYLFDNGVECFSLLGQLVDRPEVSVFQQRLPVGTRWSFDRAFQQELLASLEQSLHFRAIPLLGRPGNNGLEGRFQIAENPKVFDLELGDHYV